MIKNILFDWDGTIADSGSGIIECVNKSAIELGYGRKTKTELECFIGPPLKKSFVDVYGMDNDTALEAVRIYRKHYSAGGMLNAVLYPGITATLRVLSENYQLFIATSKPTVFTERLADFFDVKKYFVSIVGSNLDNTRSDKWEVIDYLLKEYKLGPDECIMVGDKSQDIIGAKLCGVDAVGVLWGYGTRQELFDAGEYKIINTPGELLGDIRNYEKKH